MDRKERIELSVRALDGYVHGHDAPTRATNIAMERVEDSRAVILVEGISDQIAVETLAVRRGRSLDGEGIAVLPVGGAKAAIRYMRRLGPCGRNLGLAGLCDADAAETFRQGLTAAGLGIPQSTSDMAGLGFHICTQDLEDELIRAVGPDRVQTLVDTQGELRSFRTFQKQPEWRGRPVADQLHRFFRSQARRNLRYARLMIGVVDLGRVPRPLDAVLAHL